MTTHPLEGQVQGNPEPELLDGRMWVDGCFDFFHHGAIFQARQQCSELYAGVHSDEAILANKGPTVMNLDERVAATDACRWVTKSIPYAPYVTSLPFISHYGCRYVVHGDDITSDSDGNDCYRFVKEAGRFKVVKRSPEGDGSPEERMELGDSMHSRIKCYASDETALAPGVAVWFWRSIEQATLEGSGPGKFSQVKGIQGKPVQPGQRIVYVDGGFDLFSSGHIEFLRQVALKEEELSKGGPPSYIVVGIHEDSVINEWKGVNYPIMNVFERGLCVLQCKYIHAVVFGAPASPSRAYLESLPSGTPVAVYHGPTAYMPLTYDPYKAPKEMGIYEEIGSHAFQHVNAGEIVERIMKNKEMYEARQRKKGVKAGLEAQVREREALEEEQRKKEAERLAAAN
ncbi:uncharacterized protein J7T54_004571 [Emericellopsis cladophorae]|uniref:ethanolamine-phosphate cytidylyltransferase n=1 Tax=Emericellopsis cladophorae TaxID=2686198 RepID=A0A9Q0BGS8_9HYPO|nr:uncharacterized protein J7T54_004571 [Emericellopsis cladophorae]KAI6784025.1 hypothetical protein J7T54_004571 [Emericellopsis cladophorae]